MFPSVVGCDGKKRFIPERFFQKSVNRIILDISSYLFRNGNIRDRVEDSQTVRSIAVNFNILLVIAAVP